MSRRIGFAALVALCSACLAGPCLAAGGGGAAGGAGHQRSINSGLPPGEAGPPGSPNNPRPARKPETDGKDLPPSKTAPAPAR